jgi:hypothetical protein
MSDGFESWLTMACSIFLALASNSFIFNLIPIKINISKKKTISNIRKYFHYLQVEMMDQLKYLCKLEHMHDIYTALRDIQLRSLQTQKQN